MTYIQSTYKLFVALFILFFTATSCDDFLDVVPRDKVSSEIVFNNYESNSAVLGGIYDYMSYTTIGFGVVGQNSGIHNFLISADMMGQDIIPKTFISVWQGEDYTFAGRTMEKGMPSYFWNFCYSNINITNDLLENIPNMQGTSQEKAQIEGEARLLRAFNYFMLVQRFQDTYLKNPDALGVPLYLATTIDPNPRSSMKETYAAIVDDLEWSINNMPEGRRAGSKYVLSKDAAKGILARVYMELGKYGEAKKLAQQLVDAYPLMSAADYKIGFNDVKVSECIWGLPTSARNRNGSYALPLLWSHPRKHNRWAQRFIFLNDDFVEMFNNGDVRKELIGLNPIASDYANYPERKYVSSKFMDPDNPEIYADILLMRSGEMLLIAAECEARLNNTGEAQNLLYKLQGKRNPNAVKTTSTGEELITEIFNERRKELYGEGFALFDIKRFRKPLIRTGLHTIKGAEADGVLYEADSKMFTFQIPQSEMQTNDIEQNP